MDLKEGKDDIIGETDEQIIDDDDHYDGELGASLETALETQLVRTVQCYAITGTLILALECVFYFVSKYWVAGSLALVACILVPVCGYFGSHKRHTGLLMTYAVICACVIGFLVGQWVYGFIALIQVAKMDDDDFELTMPTYSSKGAVIAMMSITLVLLIFIMVFWGLNCHYSRKLAVVIKERLQITEGRRSSTAPLGNENVYGVSSEARDLEGV